jgi:hypothetical protein
MHAQLVKSITYVILWRWPQQCTHRRLGYWLKTSLRKPCAAQFEAEIKFVHQQVNSRKCTAKHEPSKGICPKPPYYLKPNAYKHG